MTDEPTESATRLAERLQVEGHGGAAQRLHDVVGASVVGRGALHALRDACEFVLTAVEALDSKTKMMAEELRLEVARRLEL